MLETHSNAYDLSKCWSSILGLKVLAGIYSLCSSSLARSENCVIIVEVLIAIISDLKVKEYLKDPSKFAVAAAPVVVLKLIIVFVYIYMH